MTMSTSALRTAWAPACTPKGPVFLDAYKALDACFKAHGYRPTAPDCGAYSCRAITGGTGYSLHSYGPGDSFTFWTGLKMATSLAVDINWQANPYGPRLVTDMPRAMVDAVIRVRTRNGQQVWRWGGDYRTNKDAMHFEIVCSPRDLGTGIDQSTVPGQAPEEIDMTPDQIAKLNQAADDAADAKRMIAVMYEQIIGDKPKAGLNALRQLWREDAADSDRADRQTRKAKG